MTASQAPQGPVVVNDILRCHCISRDPIIIMTYGNPIAAATMLAPYLEGRKVYFLCGTWWSFSDKKLLYTTRQAYNILRDTYPTHNYIFLTNDPEENRALGRLGMPNYFCHHNAFLDERLFKPLPGVARDLDAVYTARLDRFKRHFLARDIPSWGLVYYFLQEEREEQECYLGHLRRAMPQMVPLNDDPVTGRYRGLSAPQVCQAYNRARVGLCLSAVEGGNYATTEYLLCGLPVVSTPSKGGRAAFLDPEISMVVPPEPAAVAAAVAELVARDIPPREVRLRTLVRLREMREDFIRLVSSILQQEGVDTDFAATFDTLFVHKMLTHPGSAEKFLRANGLLAT